MIVFSLFGKDCLSQKADTAKPINYRTLLIQSLKDLSDCQEKVQSLELLVEDTTKLLREIADLNAAIEVFKNRIKAIENSSDTASSIIAKQQKMIVTKDDQIYKLSKPKKISLGVGTGYGIAGQTFGVFLGLTLSYTFLRL